MVFWTIYVLISLTVSQVAFSGSGGGHGSVADLLWPAVNVAILFGLLIWKTKGSLQGYFDKKAEDVTNTVERASLKSKEAQLMLDSQQRKLANLQNELKQISYQTDVEISNLDKKLSKENQEKTSKMKGDAKLKIEAEKKAMLDELNAELLDQVIAKAKSTIKTNKDYQAKVSTKLLKGLQ